MSLAGTPAEHHVGPERAEVEVLLAEGEGRGRSGSIRVHGKGAARRILLNGSLVPSIHVEVEGPRPGKLLIAMKVAEINGCRKSLQADLRGERPFEPCVQGQLALLQRGEYGAPPNVVVAVGSFTPVTNWLTSWNRLKLGLNRSRTLDAG